MIVQNWKTPRESTLALSIGSTRTASVTSTKSLLGTTCPPAFSCASSGFCPSYLSRGPWHTKPSAVFLPTCGYGVVSCVFPMPKCHFTCRAPPSIGTWPLEPVGLLPLLAFAAGSTTTGTSPSWRNRAPRTRDIPAGPYLALLSFNFKCI